MSCLNIMVYYMAILRINKPISSPLNMNCTLIMKLQVLVSNCLKFTLVHESDPKWRVHLLFKALVSVFAVKIFKSILDCAWMLQICSGVTYFRFAILIPIKWNAYFLSFPLQIERILDCPQRAPPCNVLNLTHKWVFRTFNE